MSVKLCRGFDPLILCGKLNLQLMKMRLPMNVKSPVTYLVETEQNGFFRTMFRPRKRSEDTGAINRM